MVNLNQIYLDYQATTPLSNRVFDAMKPYFSEKYGNPHSHHHFKGWEANSAIESAREQISNSINADPSEIIFTSGATESNNLALLGLALGSKGKRNKILISAIEHKCVLSAARYLSDKGFTIVKIPVNEIGLVDLEFLENELDDSVLMVSIMDVNNEIGTIQPMDTITSLCQKNGAIFHTDAAQSMPTKIIDVKQSNIDLLSLSAHKIYGPKGIGAIYIRKGLEQSLQPLQWGGGQEQGLRSGTLPTPLCVGFGKAMEIIQKERAEIISNISKQRNLFYEECIREKKEISLVGPSFDNRHIGNLSICFHGYDAEDIISIMQPNLAVSTGSACTSGMPETSHVLNAIGMLSNDVKSVIRFSFGKYLTNNDSILSMGILFEALDKVDSRK